MMKKIFENIQKNQDTRKNLIELKAKLKDENNRKSFIYNYADKKDVFINLLNSTDPKIRKNTAIIMGQLRDKAFLEPLIKAYREETTLFVKADYLSAIGEFNYSEYVDELKERLNLLRNSEVEESDKKHINEEIRIINSLVSMYEGSKKHEFVGINEKPAMILLVNKNCTDIIADKIEKATAFNAGVIIEKDTISIKDVLNMRTYSELLFVVDGMKVLDTDIENAAKKIANSKLWDLLSTLYKNSNEPFNFRIELKEKIEPDKKSKYTKRLSSEIERLTSYKLVNNTSDYEIEIRLIKNKMGNYNCLVKLYSINDNRFEYRQNVIPESIKPSDAALLMEVAKDYLKEDARVIDPFCGVGTMLIERYYHKKTNTLYGIDKNPQAIEFARMNTDYAKKIVHYINKDTFGFEHEYKFDEIVTNMPMERVGLKEKSVKDIYKAFAKKALELIEDDGIIMMYSHNREYVKEYFSKDYVILMDKEINKKQGAYLFVIKKR